MSGHITVGRLRVSASTPARACPHYIGTVTAEQEYAIEIALGGTYLFVIDNTTSERVNTYHYPGLTIVTATAASGETFLNSLAVDSAGVIGAGTGSGTVIIYSDLFFPFSMAWHTIYTASSGRAVAIKRRCDNVDNVILLETRDISGTMNVQISDMVLQTGATTVLLAETTLQASGDTGVVGNPVTTPDGAVWFTFYLNYTSPGSIFRWHPDTGLQRVPGVGQDGSPGFASYAGPYTGTGVDLVPQADSSVAAHFADYPTVEAGKLIAPDLTVTDFACFDAFSDGPPLFVGSEPFLRIAASCNLPDCSTVVLSPFNGAFNYYWGT